MSQVKVLYNSYDHEVEEPSQEYLDGELFVRRPRTNASVDVVGIEVVGKNDYFDVVSEFDVEDRIQYYLLYAVFEAGDSFGRDGGNPEWIGLYRDFEFASEQARKIDRHADEYCQYRTRRAPKGFEEFSVLITANNGTEYRLHTPWNGYFERLQDVRVEAVTV